MSRSKPVNLWRLPAVLLTLGSWLVSPGAQGQQPSYAGTYLALSTQSGLPAAKQSLREALDALAKKYQVKFAINDGLVDGKFLNSTDLEEGSLDKTLHKILPPLGLQYKLVNGYYVIQPQGKAAGAGAEASVAPLSPARTGERAVAPKITVTGRVTSGRENFPLPGVVVVVKGTTEGTSTNVNGTYSLNVVDEDAVLVFSYVGYTTQEIPVAGRSVINVTLQESVETLKEVVITVPYGTQTRASYTGSATTVRSEEVADRPRASFQESLQGNVAGVQVSQGSGQPGAAVAVRIRGISSYSGNNDPLYVVDGIPMTDVPITGYAWSSNNLAGINPNDIETITVLKDASATSIYGSRGANGVILITTKKGQAGKTNIDLTVQHGVSEMTMRDRNKPLNTAEMSELLIEGVLNNPTYNISTREAAYGFLVNQGLNPEQDTDWEKLITRTGRYAQYNIGASGGTERTTFHVSGGYFKQDAVIKGVDYERLNTRINLTHQANDRLSFDGGLGANYQDMNTMRAQWWGENPIRNLRLTVPWVDPYNEDGSYNTSILYNNEILVNENRKNTQIYQLLGNLGATFKIIEPLSFETRVATDFNISDEELYWDPLWVDAQELNGVGGNYVTKVTNWNVTNLLKYRQTFGDLGVDATLGQEAQKTSRKLLAGEKANFAAQGLETLDAASQLLYVGSGILERSIASYFLNTSFNYQGKYYLNLTGRRDGASVFGRSVQYGNFGSVGLAWNLEQETFMQPLEVVNELKLRASYGINGNMPGDWYGWQGIYSVGANYNNAPGYVYGRIQNPFLTWENNKPFDVGVDFALFNYRLTGTFDYYTRTTTDLLMNVPQSYVNAGPNNTISSNVGSFKNRGIEFSLTSQNIRSEGERGLNWTTSFNITTQKNEIFKLEPSFITTDEFFAFEEGNEMYAYYMRGWAGADPETGQGLWYTDGTKTATTTVFNDAARFHQGSSIPDFFGGLTNTVGYKGFTLSFQLFYNWGNKIYDNYGRFTQSDGSAGTNIYGAMDRVQYENRWRQPGDNTFVPKVVFMGTQTGLSAQNSTRFLYDGSYLRLRDITLSYDIPAVANFLNKAQVYVRGNNLWTLLKDDVLPYDPEGYVGGLNNGQVPVSRQVLVGVNLTF